MFHCHNEHDNVHVGSNGQPAISYSGVHNIHSQNELFGDGSEYIGPPVAGSMSNLSFYLF